MGRLVCVSNRLPGENSSGGLVVALHGALKRSGGVWVGFSGTGTETPARHLTPLPGADFERMSFDLTPEEYRDYYLGFSNSVLWPIFHGRSDLSDIQREYLCAYRKVNTKIARQLAEILGPDDKIWVQDYHLLPLAAALREQGVTAPIGLFLHIPFPGPAEMSALPNAAEVLDWMSHFDLIGLQAERDVHNFLETAGQLDHLEEGNRGEVRLCGRRTRVAAFPIGIDTEDFMATAEAASPEDRIRSLTGAELMIGVDRLDYSKGIPQRFRAFQTLLEDHPELHKRITFLQIAPPTREEVDAYQTIREETEHLAGRINGRFATINWTPISYIHRAIPREKLAGLYRQARIGLVTPLADGMNLVAKEFVAAQDPGDPGVLILSRFAGAAERMPDALIVNPHDAGEMAEAIARALDMPLGERQDRHGRLLETVRREDVHWWSARFLGALDKVQAERPKASAPAYAGE